MRRRRRVDLLPYVLVAPVGLLLLAISLYPSVYAVRLALTDASLLRLPRARFVGFQNLVRMAGDPVFVQGLWRTARWASGQPARVFTQGRGLLPVRRSISADPVFQQNRFFKLAIAQAATWWRPPFSHKHWANYQDKIAPYWQQALRQEISVKDFHARAAKFLRGEG